MPQYTYECGWCGQIDIRKPMATAEAAEYCPLHAVSLMRRIYNPQRIIIRPRGYNLKPGEKTSDGLAFDDFSYELERHELTDDATGAYDSPESRQRKELSYDAIEPLSQEAFDKSLGEQAHQELHEWARATVSRHEEYTR